MAERTFLGGFTNTVLHEESDGTIVIEERQDCESILDLNARKRNEQFSAPTAFAQEAFNVPMVKVLQWQRECGAAMFSDEHMAYMEAQLRLPENAKMSAAPKLRDPRVIIRGAR